MKNNEFRKLYETLLHQEWKNRPVWKLLEEKEMSIAPHFVGRYYEETERKLMIVGRCLNGWEVEYPNCETIENTLDSVLEQPSRFEDAVNENGIPYIDENGNEKRYYYSRSAFWRLIKKLSVAYNGEENWNEKIVWSNLYKVAPRKGGNPSWRFIKKKYLHILI